MENGSAGGSVGGESDIDWDELVADIAISTGWTWDHILDTVTMRQLTALRKYPPLHKLAAAYMGWKPADDRSVEPPNFQAFLDTIPQRF